MTYISRITKLKAYKNVLIGRDIGNALKEGHVYGIANINGTIILEDLGEHALMNTEYYKHEQYTVSQHLHSGVYALTKSEYEMEKSRGKIVE